MNVVTEPEWCRLAPPGVSVHTTRMLLQGAMTPQSYARMDEDVANAARLLGTARPDAIAYACTAGSVLADSAEIVKLIERESGAPAVTTSQAVVEALIALGIKRVAVGTPYVDFVNDRQRSFLEDAGFEVVSIRGLGMGKTYEERSMISRQAESVAYELAKEVDSPRADGILISCAALASIGVLQRLEAELGKPVVSSSVATFWAAVRPAGGEISIPGFGTLLRRCPPRPAVLRP